MTVKDLREKLYNLEDTDEVLFCDTDKCYGEGFKLEGIYTKFDKAEVVLVMNADF